MKQYQTKNIKLKFLGIKQKTYEFFAYFVQNLVLIVLNFIPFYFNLNKF
jgi:hypothetical protein